MVTTGTLSGRITDGVAGDPIAGATVHFADLGGGARAEAATTSADGRFSATLTAGAVVVSAPSRSTPRPDR